LHWHPGKNIASFLLRYPEDTSDDDMSYGKKEKKFAHFAFVWSLDEDRVISYYKGFNISFCHEYPVVGDLPERFWHSVDDAGSGKCPDGTPVTWYEGKWNTLFVPYGIKRFRLGFDKSERPVCAVVEPYNDYKKDEVDDDVRDAFNRGYAGRHRQRSFISPNHLFRKLSHHSKGPTAFDLDFDDTPPTMNLLLPPWLKKQCRGQLTPDEEADMDTQLNAVPIDD